MVKIGEHKLQHKDVKPTTTEEHETESRALDMNEKKPVDESQPILALELAALEIVNQLSSMAGVRSDTLADKSVVGLRVVEEEILPDIDVYRRHKCNLVLLFRLDFLSATYHHLHLQDPLRIHRLFPLVSCILDRIFVDHFSRSMT
jgi:hypothetical protein